MTPEEFKHSYTMHVLTQKPMFVYRVDGTLTINLVLRYDNDSEFVSYIPLHGRETNEDGGTHYVNGREFKGIVLETRTSDILHMHIDVYSFISYEYEFKYSFRWHNEKEYINSRMKYAQVL